ncbi:MAG: riboflavin synthase [Gemmatimonadota bacterium]|nr:riboflavin synthase [Gemmatimonadota bacterium]
MFTGLVDDVGIVERLATTDAGREFRIACRYDDLRNGESMAVNGVCLTVRERGPRWFDVAAVSTTIARTTMGNWGVGRRVNLERSLRLGDPFGGHIVQGHVDGVGEVREVREAGDARLVDVSLPATVAELAVPRGSIAIDGVSLTVSELLDMTTVRVSLIEYTLRHTTLGDLAPGHGVHVEGDIIGKYVQRLIAAYHPAAAE